jgi:hypothetical protein
MVQLEESECHFLLDFVLHRGYTGLKEGKWPYEQCLYSKGIPACAG